MKNLKWTLAGVLLWLAIAATVFANSHPDLPNNGKDSPRFYASPPGHPEHP